MYVIHCKNNKQHKDAAAEGYEVSYVGRPTAFGNPFTFKPVANTAAEHQVATRDESITSFEKWITSPEQKHLLDKAKVELRGKVLSCWCFPQPCHAEVLLRLVNQ